MSLVFILFAISLAAVLLIASVAAARAQNLAAVYRRVANLYHGSVEQQGPFGCPTAQIAHRDTAVHVSVVRPFGALGPRSTQAFLCEAPLLEYVKEESGQCAVSFVDVARKKAAFSFSCQVTPAGFFQRMRYLVGGRTGLTGSPHFDLNYAIETDDPEQARRLLSRYVQVQIDRLRYLQGGDDVFVLFQGGALTVQRRRVIRNERMLRQFIAYSLDLYDQAAAAFAIGIDIVESKSGQGADAVCKVCGDSLQDEESEVVYCRVCDTPHHRDCWRYFGGCSVYACGERRYARGPRAPAN